MSDQQAVSREYFERRAREGYGIQTPESHVVRFYHHMLREHFRELGRAPRMFDFGCWNGTHPAFFASHGLEASGADIVAEAIDQARERVPSGDFRVIDNSSDLVEIFGGDFDIVFSNQVLYFLDDATLLKRLAEFSAMLRPGGLLLATMLSRACFYSRHSVGRQENGLEKIVFTEPARFVGRSTYVRFTEDAAHLKAIFAAFEPVSCGRYECDLDGSHSTEHFIFLGRAVSESKPRHSTPIPAPRSD